MTACVTAGDKGAGGLIDKWNLYESFETLWESLRTLQDFWQLTDIMIYLDSVGSNKLIDVNIEYLALSNNLLPQTKKEREAEAAAAVRERDKLQSQAKKKEETKLCW